MISLTFDKDTTRGDLLEDVGLVIERLDALLMSIMQQHDLKHGRNESLLYQAFDHTQVLDKMWRKIIEDDFATEQ